MNAINTKTIAAALAVLVVLGAGCVSRDFSDVFAARTSIPAYEPPKDGSGWPSEPLDGARPWPSEYFTDYPDEHFFTLGPCSWLGEDLLRELGWTGAETGGPPCVVPLPGGEVMQIMVSGPYGTFTDTPDDLAFIRSIDIAGLEAREYSMAESEEAHPGSCDVAVNTHSVTSLRVLIGTADGTPSGTRAEPQCERARVAATRIVRTFVPLAGGTPWPRTVQQPDTGVLRYNSACDLFGDVYLYGYYNMVTGTAKDEPGLSTCIYEAGGVRIRAWVALDQSLGNWRTRLPAIGERDLTEDIPLGVMPGVVQLGRTRFECARALFVPENEGPVSDTGSVSDAPGSEMNGVVLGMSYTTEDRRRSAPELCLIAQRELASTVEQIMDSTT